MSAPTKRHKRNGLTKAETWKRLGFQSADKEGKDGDAKKYRAMCLHCQKCQSNTSIDRLIIHRKSCPAFTEDLTEELGASPPSGKSTGAGSREQSSATEPSPPAAADAPTSNEFTTNAGLMETLLDEDDQLVRIELDQLVAAPLPTDSNRLQKDLIKAETEYLEAKSAYFNKMNEIAELRRTVTMLEAKKTQLEIVKLRAECE